MRLTPLHAAVMVLAILFLCALPFIVGQLINWSAALGGAAAAFLAR